MALGTDGHPRGLTPKLESVGTDPDERFYMLATFCFDLSRKLKYITLALQEFYKPDMISWEEMARRAEQVMKEMFAEVQKTGYPEILNELADRADSQQAK